MLPILPPFVRFIGTLATDLAYRASANVLRQTFSIGLIAVGLVMAGFDIVAGFPQPRQSCAGSLGRRCCGQDCQFAHRQ